jgi:glycine cleavage system transcriptional repressor
VEARFSLSSQVVWVEFPVRFRSKLPVGSRSKFQFGYSSKLRGDFLQRTVVITGAGRDQVGIVAQLTGVLYKLGCNLLDSSMTLLRGEFAIILMTTLGEQVTLEQLRVELEAVQDALNFHLQIRELSEDQLKMTAGMDDKVCIISVYGADKPGIVSGITNKLAELGANITDVETTRTSQDPGASSVFIMILEAGLPEGVQTDFVRTELKKSAIELGVDVTVQELEVVDL